MYVAGGSFIRLRIGFRLSARVFCLFTCIPSLHMVTQVRVLGTPSTSIIQAEHLPIAQKNPLGLRYLILRLNSRRPFEYSAAATVSESNAFIGFPSRYMVTSLPLLNSTMGCSYILQSTIELFHLLLFLLHQASQGHRVYWRSDLCGVFNGFSSHFSENVHGYE